MDQKMKKGELVRLKIPEVYTLSLIPMKGTPGAVFAKISANQNHLGGIYKIPNDIILSRDFDHH